VFDIGVGELAVIAVVALLVFGPDRLPEMARQAGGWLRDLRRAVASARSEMSDSLGVDPRYLADPKGSLQRELLGDDMPAPPTTRQGVSKALGLHEVSEAIEADPVDPDAT
jgi:Tat protein translocase TatB subunit